MSSCTCTIADETGLATCERHGCLKSPPMVKLCQAGFRGESSGKKYLIAWEEGRGPGQRETKPAKTKPQKPPSGPGTELKSLFHWLGIEDTGCGGCGGMAARMDRWGPAQCRNNLKRIVDHLEKQAAERNLPFSRFAATKLVRLAIWKAERKSNA